MANKTPKPTFSILSLLLALTVVGLGLAYVAAKRETANATKALADARKFQGFLAGEAGYIDDKDTSKLYVREMENQVPLARSYRVSFPFGHYRVVVGDWLGGELKPENVKRRHHSLIRLRMQSRMTIHVLETPPDGDLMFSVDTIDFNSGQSGGN